MSASQTSAHGGQRTSRLLAALPALLGADVSLGEPDRASHAGLSTPRLFGLSLGALSAHGAVAGLFQGGGQIWVGALKAPLVAIGAELLCVPTLVVAGGFAGLAWSPARLARSIATHVAALAVLLAGLLPIQWLFAVSSRWLGSMIVVEVVCGATALVGARRALLAFLGEESRRVTALWSALVLVVAFQVATVLQPVLLRDRGEPLFHPPRRLFLEQYDRSRALRLGSPPEPVESDVGRTAGD